jgi:hypothetical protein
MLKQKVKKSEKEKKRTFLKKKKKKKERKRKKQTSKQNKKTINSIQSTLGESIQSSKCLDSTFCFALQASSKKKYFSIIFFV